MSSDNVIISPEAHKPRLEKFKVLPGSKMTEVLRCAINQGYMEVGDLPYVEIHVDGVKLPRCEAVLDQVVEDGQIVQITMALRGDNPLRNAFQLLVQVTAIVVGAYFGPWAAAAVQVVGALATAAFFPPSRPDQLAESNNVSSLKEQSNQIRRRGVMPLVLGRQRIGFDVAAMSYSQNIGSDSWLNVIFGLHYGPCAVEQIKIGETLLADYPASDYKIEYFLTPGPRNSALYPASTNQENFNNKLDFTGGGVWEVVTFNAGASRAQIDVTWPSGLYFTNDKGKIRNEEVTGRIEYAVVGTEIWAAAPFEGYNTARDKNNALLPAGSFYVNERSADAVRRTYEWNLDPTKQYKARIKAYDLDGDFPDDQGHVWDTYLTAARSVFQGQPIVDQTLACIALRIKASGDLGSTLPAVSGIVTPIVPVYKNGNWNTSEPSSNHAALLRWILTGPPAAKPMPASQINASCATVYNLIAARQWEAAVLLTEEMSQEDAMRVCGLTGRFATYWSGEDLCFVGDWEKPIPRQIFSPTNVKGYKFRREFQDEVHAILVEFKNLDEDSRADEIWVYADGYDSTTATLFENLRLQYACNANRAFREARVYLTRKKLKTESHSFTTSFDGVTSSFGDRILVGHYVTLFSESSGRVVNRWFNEDQTQVVGLRVDFTAVINPIKDYSIDVRRTNNALTGVRIDKVKSGARTKNLYFVDPIAVAEAPRKDDLVVFGETNLVTEDVEIDDFEYSSAREVTINASRYIADQMMAAETGPIPDLPTRLKPKTPTPKPRVLSTLGRPEGVEVVFDVRNYADNPNKGFVAKWRYSSEGDNNSWNTLPVLGASARSFKTPPIYSPSFEPGDAVESQILVDIQLITLSNLGDFSQPTTILRIPIQKAVARPTGFDAIGVIRSAPDGSKYPVIAVMTDSVTSGDIQYLDVEIAEAEEGELFTSPGQPLPASNPVGDFRAVLAGETYIVRARWRTQDNWVSDWVYKGTLGNPVLVPAGSNIATDVSPDSPIWNSLEDNQQAIAEEILRGVLYREYYDAQIYLDGTPIGTAVRNLSEEYTDFTGSYAATMALLGAKNAGGTGWILNADTVFIPATGGGGQLDSLRSLQLTTENNTTEIEQLLTVTDGFAEAKALLVVNGYVSGVVNQNDGTTSSFRILADNLFAVAPNGGNPVTIFEYSGSELILTNTRINGNLAITGTFTNRAMLPNTLNGLVVVDTNGVIQLNGTTPVRVQELIIPIEKNNSPVKVEFNGLIFMLHNASGSFNMIAELRRQASNGANDSILRSRTINATGDTYDAVSQPLVFKLQDVPGQGTWRYYVNIRSTTSNMTVQTVTDPYMEAIEYKSNTT